MLRKVLYKKSESEGMPFSGLPAHSTVSFTIMLPNHTCISCQLFILTILNFSHKLDYTLTFHKRGSFF